MQNQIVRSDKPERNVCKDPGFRMVTAGNKPDNDNAKKEAPLDGESGKEVAK